MNLKTHDLKYYTMLLVPIEISWEYVKHGISIHGMAEHRECHVFLLKFVLTKLGIVCVPIFARFTSFVYGSDRLILPSFVYNIRRGQKSK